MSTENIGGVGISVDVDLSGLEQKFQEAVSEAATDGQKIGQAIAEGISSGAESGAAAFDAAMAQLTAGGLSANEAFQQLTGSAQTFMEALQSGAVNEFADNFGKIADAAQPAAAAMDSAADAAKAMSEQLSLFDNIGEPFANAAGQVNLFSGAIEVLGSDSVSATTEFDALKDSIAAAGIGAGGIEPLAEAVRNLDESAKSAGPSVHTLGEEEHSAGEHAKEAKESVDALKEAIGLLGFALSVDAFIEFGKSFVEARDDMVAARIAMTALTGDAKETAESLERLEQLGVSDGLAMPALISAAKNMTAILPEGTDVIGILTQLADASGVTGRSVDSLAGTFDRLANSTNIAPRMLAQLGLNMKDLQQAFEDTGASATTMSDNIKTAWSELSVNDKIAVLQTAMEKLQGVQKDIADQTLTGAWHQAMAQWDADITIMTRDLGGLSGLGGVLKSIVNDIAVVFVAVGSSINGLMTQIAGDAAQIVVRIQGIGTAVKDLATGDFAGAAKAMSDAAATIAAMEAKTTADIDAQVQRSKQTIHDLLNQTSTDLAVVIPKIDGLGDATKHAAESAKQAAVEIVKLAQATHDLRDFTQAAVDPMQTLGAAADAAQAKLDLMATQALHLNANMLAADAALKDAALQYQAGQIGLGEYEKALNNFVTAADKAAQKQRELNAALSSAETATALAAMVKNLNDAKQASTDAGTAIGQLGILAGQAAPAMSPLNQAMIDAGVNAQKAKNAFQDLHTPIEQIVSDMGRLAEAARDSGDWSGVTTAIENFDRRIQELSKTDLPEADRQMQAFVQGLINARVPAELVQGQLDKLGQIVQKMAKEDLPGAGAAWQAYLAILAQVPHTYGQILEAQAAQLQSAIHNAEMEGTAADTMVMKLEGIRLKQEELKLSADGIGSMWVGIAKDVVSAFDAIGKSVADNIIDGKNWGQVWEGLLKNFAKTILETVIQAALQPLKIALLDALSAMLGVQNATAITMGGINALAPASQAAGAALSSLASSANAAAASISTSMGTAGGAKGEGASGLAGSISHLATVIGIVTEIISAGAAVASTILLAHISSDTGHIEVNTREAEAELLNVRADLWHQHDDYLAKYDIIYERLGDMWATLQTLGGSGGSALNDTQSGDLQTIAINSTGILSDLQDIDIRVNAANGWFKTIDSTVSGGLSTINSTLFIIIARLDSVISAINYHGQHNDNSQDQQVAEMRAMNAKAIDGPNAIVRAISGADAHSTALINQIQGGVNHIGQSVDQQISQGERQLGAANAQLAAALSVADRIAALQNIIRADSELIDAAIRAGDMELAEQYRQAAENATRELTPLLSSIDAGVSQVNTGMSNTITAVDRNSGYVQDAGFHVTEAVRGGSSQIVNAIQQSDVVLSAGFSAMAGSLAASLAALIGSVIGAFGAAGGGLPGGQPGLPSGSGGSTKPSGPYDPGMYNPPPTGGPGGYTPGGPLGPLGGGPAPSTAPNYGGIPGAYKPGPGALPYIPGGPVPSPGSTQTLTGAPVGGTTPVGGVPNDLPHFAGGGIMPWTGLAHLEAGEMALPPDVSAMLRRMASTPSMSASFPNPAAGSAVTPGNIQQTNIFNVYGGSAQENVRQIAVYMKTVSPKMAALSS